MMGVKTTRIERMALAVAGAAVLAVVTLGLAGGRAMSPAQAQVISPARVGMPVPAVANRPARTTAGRRAS